MGQKTTRKQDGFFTAEEMASLFKPKSVSFIYPVPETLRGWGYKWIEENPDKLPPVFAVENPNRVRSKDHRAEEAPEFLVEGIRSSSVYKARLILSSHEVDLLCAMYDGRPIFKAKCFDKVVRPCAITEIPGAKEFELTQQEQQALENPKLRPSMDLELLFDSIEMARYVYKIWVCGCEFYFVLVEAEAEGANEKPNKGSQNKVVH